MTGSHLAAVVLALVAHVGLLREEPPVTEAEFRQQIQRLDRKNDQAGRLKALKWIAEHPAAKQAELAIPALEHLIRKDPDEKIRDEALLAISKVARKQGKPCPLVLLEAVLDDDVGVRQSAGTVSEFFTTYAPGAVPVLLRGVWSEDAGIRSDCLRLLACAGPRDQVVLAVIETAMHDRIFQVRHNAHCAKFRATNNLGEFLGWLVRLQEDEEGVLYPLPEEKDLRAQERTVRNLAVIGSATLIIEWCDKRPDELAAALLQLLDSKSPLVRRGAARLIGAAFVKVNPPQPGKSGDDFSRQALSYLYHDTKSPKTGDETGRRAEKSKAGVCLEKLNVRDRLAKLSADDMDPAVRRAARDALGQLALVQKKKP